MYKNQYIDTKTHANFIFKIVLSLKTNWNFEREQRNIFTASHDHVCWLLKCPNSIPVLVFKLKPLFEIKSENEDTCCQAQWRWVHPPLSPGSGMTNLDSLESFKVCLLSFLLVGNWFFFIFIVIIIISPAQKHDHMMSLSHKWHWRSTFLSLFLVELKECSWFCSLSSGNPPPGSQETFWLSTQSENYFIIKNILILLKFSIWRFHI